MAKINSIQPDLVKIVLTGAPSVEDRIKVTDQGATAYLIKPIKSEELVRLIKEKLRSLSSSAPSMYIAYEFFLVLPENLGE